MALGGAAGRVVPVLVAERAVTWRRSYATSILRVMIA